MNYKFGAFAGFARNLDVSIVEKDNMLDYGKPQSSAPLPTGVGFVDRIKAFEDSVLVFQWNTNAFVADDDFYCILILSAKFDSYRSFFGIFNCIVDQIYKNLFQSESIGVNFWKIGLANDFDF